MYFEQLDEVARAEKLSKFLISKGFSVSVEDCNPHYKFSVYRTFNHCDGDVYRKFILSQDEKYVVESVIVRGEFSSRIYSCTHMDKVVYQTVYPINGTIRYKELEKVSTDVISKFKENGKMTFVESSVEGCVDVRNEYTLINSYYVLLTTTESGIYANHDDPWSTEYFVHVYPPIVYRLD